MDKAAIISLTIPEIPGKSGGEIRDVYLFEYIGRKFDVDYFSIHNYFGKGEIDPEFGSLFANIYYPQLVNEKYHEYVDTSVELTPFLKFRLALMNRGAYIPKQSIPAEILGFRNEFNRWIKKFFQEMLKQKEYKYVIISPQVNPAIVEELDIPKKTKLIWATYDVERVRHRRLLVTKKGLFKKRFYRFEIAAACRYEEKAVQNADGIISVSELDKVNFVKSYKIPNKKVLSIENGVDTGYFYKMPVQQNCNIVFVGNMGYLPNQQAASHFVKNILPIVIAKEPKAHFYAVGAGANTELKMLESESVTVTGRVEDVRVYLEKARVICVPLLTGSGTKYKVLEAMSCGKAVITTDIGAEGLDVLDEKNIIIANSAEDIADKLLECFYNDAMVEKIGNEARKFVLEKHDWNVVLPKLEPWFQTL